MDEVMKLLREAWMNASDDNARRTFRNYRTQIEDVRHFADRLDTLLAAMLRDNVDLRPYNEAEVDGGDCIYQCITSACDDLMMAHSRVLTYYEAARAKLKRDE